MVFLSFILYIIGFLILVTFASKGRIINFQYPVLILFGASLCICAFQIKKIAFNRLNYKYFIVFFIFCCYYLIRANFSEVNFLKRLDTVILVHILVTFILFTFFFNKDKYIITFFYVLVGLVIINLIFIFIQIENPDFNILYKWGHKRIFGYNKDAPGGIFNLHNHMTGFLNPIIFLLMGYVLWGRGRINKIVFSLAVIVGVYSVVVSTSRGGLLNLISGFIALGGVFIFYKIRSYKISFIIPIIYIFVTLIVVGITFMLATDNLPINDNLKNKIGGDNRTENWASLTDQFKLNPLFGNGSRSYEYNSLIYWSDKLGAYHKDMVFAHNEYIQTVTDYGVLSLVLFFILFSITIIFSFLKIKNIKIKHNLAYTFGGLIAIMGYCAHNLVDFNMHITVNATLITIALSICLLKPRDSEELKENNKRKNMNLLNFILIFIISIFSIYLGGRYVYSGFLIEYSHLILDRKSSKYLKNMLNSKKLDRYNYTTNFRLAYYYYRKGIDFTRKVIKNKGYHGSSDLEKIMIKSYFFNSAEEYEQTTKLYPQNYKTWFNTARMYAKTAETTPIFTKKKIKPQLDRVEELFEKANSYYERATNLCKRRIRPHDYYSDFLRQKYIPFLIKFKRTKKIPELVKVAKYHYKMVTKNISYEKRDVHIKELDELLLKINTN